jgi:hypothetical protein
MWLPVFWKKLFLPSTGDYQLLMKDSAPQSYNLFLPQDKENKFHSHTYIASKNVLHYAMCVYVCMCKHASTHAHLILLPLISFSQLQMTRVISKIGNWDYI